MAARYDVVVLGGGTAGCVLAARLTEESERSVCLVEAGPYSGPHSWETDGDDRSPLRARTRT